MRPLPHADQNAAGGVTADRAVAGVLAIAFLAQVWVALHYEGIAEDGAYCLRVLLTGNRPSCLEPARWAIQLGFEAPVLIAARWFGVSTAAAIAIYGLTLQLAPLAITALAATVPPRTAGAFRFVPVFCYFASASGIVSYGLVEGPTAAAWFWLVLYRLLFGSERGLWLTLALVAPAPFVHEVVAFLGLPLVAAAWLRAEGVQGRFRAAMRLAALFLAAAAAVQAVHIIVPHRIANRDDLLGGLIALRWLYDPANGFDLAAALGLLATATLFAAWRWRSLNWIAPAVFAAIALTCGIEIWHWPMARAPIPLFVARDQPAFVAVVASVVVLVAWTRPESRLARRLTVAAPESAVLAALAFATIMELLALNGDWSTYIGRFRATLAHGEGLIAWRDAGVGATPDEAAILARFTWGWTNPDLSLLLSPERRIRAIVANPEVPGGTAVPWRPWDPTEKATWPRDARFDMDGFQPFIGRQ